MTARLSCAVLLALVLAGSARADLIRFTDQVSGPVGTFLRIEFPQFDPALGELTAVRWEISSGIGGRLVFDNENPTPFSRQLPIGAFIGASVTAGASNAFLDAGQFPLINLAADDEPDLPPDFAGSDSRTLLFTGGNFDTPLVRSTSFPAYTGGGVVAMSASARTFGIPPDAGISVLIQQPLTVTLSATLTYEFVPVPEPSTLALLGLGSAAVLGYGWRRRTKP